jgi:hypothetical protein
VVNRKDLVLRVRDLNLARGSNRRRVLAGHGAEHSRHHTKDKQGSSCRRLRMTTPLGTNAWRHFCLAGRYCPRQCFTRQDAGASDSRSQAQQF